MRSLCSAKSHTAAPNEKLICLFVFYLLHTMANRNFVSWTHEPKFSYRTSWVWAQTWNDFALPAHFAGSKFEFQATWSLDLLTICTVFEVLLVVELTKPMLALLKEFQWNSQKFMKHIEGFIGSVHNVNFTHIVPMNFSRSLLTNRSVPRLNQFMHFQLGTSKLKGHCSSTAEIRVASNWTSNPKFNSRNYSDYLHCRFYQLSREIAVAKTIPVKLFQTVPVKLQPIN